jgi:chloramphenicol-sensitive protein RarD
MDAQPADETPVAFLLQRSAPPRPYASARRRGGSCRAATAIAVGAATVEGVSRSRSGLLAAVGGYLLWGLFPLYWPLLEPAAPVEILAHRIAWSLVFLLGLLALTSGFGWLRRLSRRAAGLLALAAVLVSVNWGVYIYGVNSEHVVETSLGYFINPLLTVVLAMVFLHERLRRWQGFAVAVAAAGVLVLTVDYGRVPWIALTLALSFGLYGLVKKRAGVDGTPSLAVETAVIVLPAAAYLVWLGGTGRGTFTSEGPGHTALLLGAGVVTALPLMLFGAAAVRIRLSTLGLLQYLTPTIQFLIGVLFYGEPMPLSRLAGFALVWIALVIFMLDALGASRARVRAAPAHAPA